MDKITETVLSQKIDRDALISGTYIPREGLQIARKNMENDLIQVITGPRRAGKSVFALQLLQGIDFGYLNFDDERLIRTTDYDDLIKALNQVYGKTRWLFFDEIQNLKDWELLVNRLQRRGYRILITGSNAHLLSRELAPHLTGRYLAYQIFPFSFSEFLKTRGMIINNDPLLKDNQGLLLNRLQEYLTLGGYPEIVVNGIDPRQYLPLLLENILFKDIVRRYNLRFSNKLYDLARYLIPNPGGEFTYTRLKHILTFRSVYTLENYLNYLMEAFLVFKTERFSHKTKERIKSPKKVYGYDTGLINSLKGQASPDRGRMLENAAAIELLRRQAEFFHYKAVGGQEVDLVVRKESRLFQLIQVCYSLEDPLTRKRELRALIKAGRELDCHDLMVLSWDQESEETMDGKRVLIRPLWKWLINR
jgi:predicted AAA+ superfamily ATPase